MNYFKDVYLKRMNMDGKNVQERVRTRKEKKFNKGFLEKSKYKGLITEIDEEPSEIICSVQPSSWKQEKIVSNILVPLKEKKFSTGTILRTYQKVKDDELDCYWLIMMVSKDLTHGYQRYEVIELDEFLNLTDEYGDTINVIPVKFVSETSVYVQDKFSSYGSVSYREPLSHRKFISKSYDFLNKNTYFNYEEKGWEIVGKDNLSIKGVSYTSVAEFLRREPEPNTSRDILVGENDNFFLNGR